MTRALLVAVLLSAVGSALTACGDDLPKSAVTILPSFGDPCRYHECSEQGLCAVEQGAPTCLCEPGYGGSRCASCERGFHRDALGRCAPDRACADQDTNPCGATGACDDSSGVIACRCDQGYEGPRCTLCQSGWDRNEFGECLQLVLGGGGVLDPPDDPNGGAPDGGPVGDSGTGDAGSLPGTCSDTACTGRGVCNDTSGQVLCACDPGYGGARCDGCAAGYHRDGTEQCVVDEECAAVSCGVNGDCEDDTGVIECTCDPGYAGELCNTCAAGYHNGGSGCVPDEQCLSTTCSGHGNCSSGAGVVTCACLAGYAGTNCTTCASGYHRGVGDACVADEVCSSSACGPHGNCSLDRGEIQCSCDGGYAGETCAMCAPGFHLDNTTCVLDQQCQPTSCPDHSTCDDSDGSVGCTCDPGYAGTLCDGCAAGYYRFFAAGTCVVYDCSMNPLDTPGSESFEGFTGFPTSPNTCLSDVNVTSFELTPSSIGGDGTVWACAPSSFYGLATRHVMLQAGTLGPAELRFAGPISELSFGYGAQTALLLDLRADGVSQRTITGARWSSGSVSLTFSAPVTLIELRSLNGGTNQIALDNITFTPPTCN